MQVGIVGGTGHEGRGLALRLASAGIATLVGSRDLEKAREVVGALQARRPDVRLSPAANAEAVERSAVVFLAVPFAHVDAIVLELGGRFQAGALLVDITVPLSFAGGRVELLEVAEGSAAEHVRARVRSDVRVAASFKTIPAAALERIEAPLDCDEFVCGDSEETRGATLDLLARIPGLRPLDAGDLRAARTLERMTALAIGLNKRYRSRGARYRMVGL